MTAHTSGRLDAPGHEASAASRHEAPELLHLDDAIDGQADRLGVCAGAKHLARPVDGLRVDEEGLACVPRGSHGSLLHRHMLWRTPAYVKAVSPGESPRGFRCTTRPGSRA